MSSAPCLSIFEPTPPPLPGQRNQWGRLYGSSLALAVLNLARTRTTPVVIITSDTGGANRLEHELRFFTRDLDDITTHVFPDWETLPYDVFSPHQDIVSERILSLYQLPTMGRGIVIVPVTTLMSRLAPRQFLTGNSLVLEAGQHLDMDRMRRDLESAGYQYVSTVYEHGEFSVRGNLIDLFPMGSRTPFRIDLFDDEVESIRSFDPETQRSIDRLDQVQLLPAREFPLDKAAISHFRHAWRARFEGNPGNCPVYRDVSEGLAPAGIEYFLPLFFEETASFFDYLPADTVLIHLEETRAAAETYWQTVSHRYDQYQGNIERPLLKPTEICLQANEIFANCNQFPQINAVRFESEAKAGVSNFATSAPSNLTMDIRSEDPTARLREFIDQFHGRTLLVAETTGRRETLLELLHGRNILPTRFDSWQAFLADDALLGITVAPLDHGLLLDQPRIAVITEPQLFGEHVAQRRRRKTRDRDSDSIVRSLAELHPGSPVVHEDHGVGRYLGLQHLSVGNVETEFLALEYAGGDKLYVPVSSLHLISRYTGVSPENAPLHRLGSGQWEKARRRATEKVRDVAAELLAVYAQREARKGITYDVDEQYGAFASAFPFEETPDQEEAISAVVEDLSSERPMDRLVCGDVGFGKTEVAMRAAFICVHGGKQVAILVPTTLLAQQHYQNFRDRFADWPVRVESLSRFRSKRDQDKVVRGLAEGSIDIVIGTHKLIQGDIRYKDLGLVIIDEEHRFGVRQKDRFKALRAEVDVLTLTATPIPRTLNMSLSGIRDLSIIATPPARRLAIRTFVSQWNDELLREACQRELKRGGQIYFLHNSVETIEKFAHKLEQLIPEATVRIGHGQMRERDLEQVMLDFYHQRFNILVCTTIIETGIDVPNANTIIINRADRLGLAQLYQLRGRVGRSHHQAYAYLLVPPRAQMTPDAVKRLEAIESIHDLGTGFTLATHDMEIRGAGELLGDEQSGHMQEIGFSLYSELLDRAVKALKAGKEPQLDRPLDHGTEIDMGVPALIPEDYIPDVHSRLVMYKRIASAADREELRELQVEMIDRFGLLPDPLKTLIRVTELKLLGTPLGIRKIDAHGGGCRLQFEPDPNIDAGAVIRLIQTEPKVYKLEGTEKLKMYKPLPEAEQRFGAVDELLRTLAVRA